MDRPVCKNKELEALMLLKAMRPMLTRQQIRSIKGQILSGEVDSAIRGLQRLCQDDACICKEAGGACEQKRSMLQV